jgi:hypothetical protein
MVLEDSGGQQIWWLVQVRLTLNITHDNCNSPGHFMYTVLQVSDLTLRISLCLTRFCGSINYIEEKKVVEFKTQNNVPS